MNSKSTGNARIKLYIYNKSHSWADINNRYYNGYNFKNVTAEQLKLYNFEQAKEHVSKESNDLSNTRHSSFARAYNNDQSLVCRRNNGRFQVGTHISCQISGECSKTNVCNGHSLYSEGPVVLNYTPSQSIDSKRLSQDNCSLNSNRRSGANSYDINQKTPSCTNKQIDSGWKVVPSFSTETNNPNPCSQEWLSQTLPSQDNILWIFLLRNEMERMPNRYSKSFHLCK